MSGTALSSIDNLLTRGGAGRIGLLRYAVMSVSLEPVALFVISEYRLRPTVAGALAIYDMFFAATAPARVDAGETNPARNVRLASAFEALRRQSEQYDAAVVGQRDTGDEDAPLPLAPNVDRALFDRLVAGIRDVPHGKLARLEGSYDPELTPEENLPDGRLSDVQLHFVNQVWRPHVRPTLVAAGFWQLSSID